MKKISRAAAALFSVALLAMPAGAAEKGSDGTKLNWFGSLRIRPEYNDNLSETNNVLDDKISYTGYRALLGAKAELDNNVNVVISGQFYGMWGEDTPVRGAAATNTTSSDFTLYEAYIEAKNIFGTPFSGRAGRQELVIGDEWLLGNNDFYGGLTWDGMRGDFDAKWGSAHIFWVKVFQPDSPDQLPSFPSRSGDAELSGGWANWKVAKNFNVQGGIVYLLDRIRVDGPAPRSYADKRWTYAVQANYGGKTGLFVDANFAIQNGRTLRVGSENRFSDIKAQAQELTGGYRFTREGLTNKLWLRYGRYSGDKSNTVENEVFNPLAGDFHGRYGLNDFWYGIWGYPAFIGGTPGLRVLQLGAEVPIPSGVTFGLQINSLGRDEAATTINSKDIGMEYSLMARRGYGKNLDVELGLAQFYPGKAANRVNPVQNGGILGEATARRIYVNAVARF